MSATYSDFVFAFDASLATPISYTEIEERLQNLSQCFNAPWLITQIAAQIAKPLVYGHDCVAFAVRISDDHASFVIGDVTLHALFNENYQGRKNNIPDAHYFVRIAVED